MDAYCADAREISVDFRRLSLPLFFEFINESGNHDASSMPASTAAAHVAAPLPLPAAAAPASVPLPRMVSVSSEQISFLNDSGTGPVVQIDPNPT